MIRALVAGIALALSACTASGPVQPIGASICGAGPNCTTGTPRGPSALPW